MILIKVVVNCNTLTNRIKLIEHSRNELIYTVHSLLMANHGKSISEKFFFANLKFRRDKILKIKEVWMSFPEISLCHASKI